MRVERQQCVEQSAQVEDIAAGASGEVGHHQRRAVEEITDPGVGGHHDPVGPRPGRDADVGVVRQGLDRQQIGTGTKIDRQRIERAPDSHHVRPVAGLDQVGAVGICKDRRAPGVIVMEADDIIPRPAAQDVASADVGDDVIAVAGIDHIVAPAAVDDIVERGPGERVVALTSMQYRHAYPLVDHDPTMADTEGGGSAVEVTQRGYSPCFAQRSANADEAPQNATSARSDARWPSTRSGHASN